MINVYYVIIRLEPSVLRICTCTYGCTRDPDFDYHDITPYQLSFAQQVQIDLFLDRALDRPDSDFKIYLCGEYMNPRLHTSVFIKEQAERFDSTTPPPRFASSCLHFQ